MPRPSERFKPFGQSVDYRVDSALMKGHSYTQGWYLVAICTRGRLPFFELQDKVLIPHGYSMQDALRFYHSRLPPAGQRICEEWDKVVDYYPSVVFDSLVVMPDHIHLLIYLDLENEIPLSQIINAFKGGCTRAIRSIYADFGWQTRFHDKRLLSADALQAARMYVHQNPFSPETL